VKKTVKRPNIKVPKNKNYALFEETRFDNKLFLGFFKTEKDAKFYVKSILADDPGTDPDTFEITKVKKEK